MVRAQQGSYLSPTTIKTDCKKFIFYLIIVENIAFDVIIT